MTAIDVARRPLVTEPGEPLLVARDPLEAALRFTVFAEATGVPETDLLVSPLCAIPLPVFPAQWEQGRRRWAGARAEAMWHPLMWLPRRVAGRYQVRQPDGSTAPESDDAWAVRVALEMTFSGLYDDATGTWMDVLALHGIDIANPAGIIRVQNWLDGADDPVLNGIDLTPLLDVPEDRAWAVAAATEMLPDLYTTSWALASDSLLEALDDLAERAHSGQVDIAGAKWHAGMVAYLAEDSFRTLPEAEGTTAFWAQMPGRIAAISDVAVRGDDGQPVAPLDALLVGPIAEMTARLIAIRESFWPDMEVIADEARAALAAQGHQEALLDDIVDAAVRGEPAPAVPSVIAAPPVASLPPTPASFASIEDLRVPVLAMQVPDLPTPGTNGHHADPAPAATGSQDEPPASHEGGAHRASAADLDEFWPAHPPVRDEAAGEPTDPWSDDHTGWSSD